MQKYWEYKRIILYKNWFYLIWYSKNHIKKIKRRPCKNSISNGVPRLQSMYNAMVGRAGSIQSPLNSMLLELYAVCTSVSNIIL